MCYHSPSPLWQSIWQKSAPDGFYGSEIYCFVDETGQDTEGKLFLVAVVLKENTQLDILEEKLLQAEIRTGKRKLKWKKRRSAMAGFLREAYEKEVYTAGYIGRFIGAKIVTET